MRNLLNPKWLLIINTFPILLLFFLFSGELSTIKSLLDQDTIHLWQRFAWTLGILGTLNFVYTGYLIFAKKNISALYGIIALLCYIPFVYIYSYYSEKMLPRSIPQWMIPTNIFLYVGTFLMPTLAHALFVLVIHFTPENKSHAAWKNFLIAVIVPITWYAFSQILLPLWKIVEYRFSIHVFLILLIIGTLICLFFLIRGVFILANKKGKIWQKYQLIWEIPIAIVFPLLGLAANNGQLTKDLSFNDTGIFGNFKNYWFYVLAAINGILICLPSLENKFYRLCLFTARSGTFTYTFYFFLVFLPFLPLSIIAIIAVGIGFLMLTPLLLFVIHTNKLYKDFAFLKNYFSKRIVRAISVISFLVIPACITIAYLKDRSVLHETLAYLYNPDYSKTYNINKASLQSTLSVVKQHKNKRNRDIDFGNQIPYLSTYFNWIVLDNLTLSDAKINTIEKIFFAEKTFEQIPESIQSNQTKITNITTNSTYDKTQNAWLSWINLEITNNSDNNWFSAYATTIDLPAGCWISDYYLYVAGKKEAGILAEKKTAMWVFSQIRNENRDPGILHYLTGNKVAFKVFPFSQHETRKTGIELLHKTPVKLTIDGNTIELGKTGENTTDESFENSDVAYVTGKQKQTLPKVQRKPYFHFLVDISRNKGKYVQQFTRHIEQLKTKYPTLFEQAKISFVNSYVATTSLDDHWKQNYQSQNFEGGFYLDRAIRTVLFNAYKGRSNTYPVIVAVTDNIQNAVLNQDFSDLKMAFPENHLFFHLDTARILQPHSLTVNPALSLPDTMKPTFNDSVLAYKFKDNTIAYVANNNEADILFRNDNFEIKPADIKPKNWISALMMQGKWASQMLHPETAEKEWIDMVKHSFLSKVMTPATSYLVVENEAQKAILQKKQEQVLSGNPSLDLNEDTPQMSEPGLIILSILLGFNLWYKAKRKRQQTN